MQKKTTLHLGFRVHVDHLRKGVLARSQLCARVRHGQNTHLNLLEDVKKGSRELNKCTIDFDPLTSSPTGFGTPYGYSPAAAAAPAYGTCCFLLRAYNVLPTFSPLLITQFSPNPT